MSCRRSFGLIEVIVVVAIFLMCLAAILPITGLSYRNLVKNEARWKAMTLAQNIIEEQRKKRDDNLLAGQNVWNGMPFCGSIYVSSVQSYDWNLVKNGSPIAFTATVGGLIYPTGTPSCAIFVDVKYNGQTMATYKTFLKDYHEWM